MSAVTLSLAKPITAHGEELAELTLRAPTTKEVIEIGYPQLIVAGDDGASTGVEVRIKVVARYISRLAAIPMSSVESLALSDLQACVGAVMGFFGMAGDGETNPSSKTAPSKSPTSGA